MYCSKCGKEIPNDAAVCPACGENQTVKVEKSPAPQGDVVSLGDWIVTTLLTWIPIVGFVMMFVWSFGGSTTPSKKNWARATLIWMAVGLVIAFLFGASLIAALVNHM